MMLLNAAVKAILKEVNEVTFLFGGTGCFDEISYHAVSVFKSDYPNLKRVYVRAKDEIISETYEKYLLEAFEKTYFPDEVKSAGYRAYVKRNQIMIDKCDVLITYYDKDYPLNKSGTKAAVKYAVKKKKEIINIHDFEKQK